MLHAFKHAPVRELPPPTHRHAAGARSRFKPILWPAAMAMLLGLLFCSGGSLLRLLDPTAGVVDIGTLSLLVFALLAGAAIRLVALLCVNQLMVVPVASLPLWQQTLFYGCLHLSYFWGMVTVLAATM